MVNQLVKFRLLILNFLEWCHRPFGKIIPAETFRYVAMGGVITFVDIFLYFICYNFVLKKQMVDLGFVVMSAHIASFVFVFPITFFTGFLSWEIHYLYRFLLKRKHSAIQICISSCWFDYNKLCFSETIC